MPQRDSGSRESSAAPPAISGLIPELPVIPQLIGLAHLQGKARFDESLAGTAITSITHWAVLTRIRETPGITGVTLASQLRVTPQAVQLVLRQLESRSLISRTPQGTAMMTYLTREGRKALKSAEPAVERYTNLTTGGLSPEELVQLERLLTTYVKAVVDPTRL
jgi:DNA-binding MarR family transcriptional regulator